MRLGFDATKLDDLVADYRDHARSGMANRCDAEEMVIDLLANGASADEIAEEAEAEDLDTARIGQMADMVLAIGDIRKDIVMAAIRKLESGGVDPNSKSAVWACVASALRDKSETFRANLSRKGKSSAENLDKF